MISSRFLRSCSRKDISPAPSTAGPVGHRYVNDGVDSIHEV
jgi:hypothetical protein